MLLRTRWLGWRHVHLRAHLRLLHGDEWAEGRRACQRRAIGRDNAVLQPLRWTSGLCDAALPECELLPPEYETAPTEDLGISTSSDIITEVDNFARARVSNFIKRVEPHNRLGVESSMEVREVEGDEGVLHVARLRLPLPPEYGHRYGEGFARQPKDAEKVAAMHAERVIDALGFSIFGLPSKQQRHAEAARAVGRWAPLPNDAPRPPTTPSPPSLCLRHGSDGEKRKQDLRMDPRGFSNVSPAATVHPLRWTVASPHFMDRGSERRLRNFFESYRANFQRYCRITPLSSGEGAAPNTTLFLAQIKLPIPPRFSERVCMGRAPTKRDAVALACMHAELTIDVLGLALYPGNRERQVAHAEECHRVGRWCAGPDECDYRYDAVAPPPLQLAATPASDAACPVAGSAEAVPSSIEATLTQTSIGTTQRRQGGVQEAEMQRAGEHSVESVLVLHSKAVAAMHRVVDVTEVDPHGRSVILHHLSHVAGIHAGAATSQFYVEALGLKDHQTFRATITVPLTQPGTESERAEDFFVAVGIARSATEAEAAASAHALLVLHHLHRRVEGMAMEEHTTFLRHLGVPASTLLDVDGTPRGVADLPAGAIPPPIRCCRDHIGRITAPGLAATTRRQRRFVADGPSAAETMHSREEVVVREVLQRRRLAPRAEWSLEADGDHRIVVSPHATPTEAKGYVHTLSAVRSPDDMAVQRLRDYLERHGQRLESSVQRTVLDVEEDGREGGAPVQLHIVRVVLPVSTRWEVLDKEQHAPATAGRCVAIGEAFTEPDALVMCAMHAELLLDALGYQMYDHPLLQRKHSDTARMLGRWAPLAAGALPPIALQVTPPPPLRKERSSSCLWARVEQQQVTQRSSGENPTLTEQCVDDGDHLMEQTDDELCDLSRLQHAPHPWLAAQKHVRAYFDKRNGSLERSMRQYSVMTPDHGPVHRAIVEIPVPSVYGKRYGVGCATNKRVAYRACLMHVLLVLDALGLPVYSGSKQKELVKHAAAVGLSQPSPGLPIKPGDSPSPAGLCTFRVDSNQLLELPTPPSTTEVDNNPQSWLAYVRACRTYMGQAREDHQNQALFQRHHAPRSGIPVEDDGLDRVEALPVHYGARARLLRLATRLGLPALEDFRYETFGRAPSKAFLTEVAVHGTPYTARGYGSTSQESIQRAAMHYEHLLTTTVIQAAGRRPAAAAIGGGAKLSSGAASRRPTHSGGPAATSECKRLALALYAIARSPFLPLQVSLHDGATSSDLPTKMVVAELRGEHGVTWSGRSELPASSCTESRAGAFQAAVVQALEQLQEHAMRHASYQAYLHFASHHPKVRVETLSQASSMEGRMEDLLPGGVMGSSDTAVDELVTVPLHLDERFPGNHTTHALLDYVERRLQQSVTPPPMVVPAPILSRLVGCGMAEAHLNTNDGDDATGGEVVVTAQGVSCAFLLQCLPPFPLFSKTPTRPDDSGVPLPIASHGDVFILQLARLLLAGLAFGCPDAAARLVALAASAPEVCTGEGGSVDLVDLATGAPSISSFPAADGYEEEVLKRLTSLKHHVRTHAPHSAFATLLQQQPIQKMELCSATVSESLKWQMRLCVAFASFPSYWLVDQDRTIMRSFSTISGPSSVPLVSTDGRTSTHVTCATADVAMKHVHCRPLFASLDCLVREGPGTRPNAGVAAVGAFTHPAQSLVAAVVGSTTAEGLTVVEDLDNVALLYGGTVPLMARDGCSSIVACHDQLAHHLSALRSPPHGLQRMLRRLCGEVE